MNFTRYKMTRARLRKGKMNEFNCRLYMNAQAKFNPVLARTGIKKVAKFAPITHKELIEPGLNNLLAAFESIPQPLSI